MVLLAAAVCNKTGKAIISRQFVEMTRSRIEGLLAAFPKLMNTGKQHTFVETESVRYVYQPLEKLYVVLITTKASNILEDLETLRLFARVIPEYCRNMEETDIVDQAFPLIFAFDEVVALGYRENVNLAQIRTFTEMDSHEEAVAKSVRETQEREAKDLMKKRAKELQVQRRDAQKGGGRNSAFGGGFGNSSYSSSSQSTVMDTPVDTPKPSYTASASRPSGGGKALRLGSKKKDVDTFVGQLESEGEKVSKATTSLSTTVAKASTPAVDQDGVHIAIEEKISVSAGRDGGLHNMEIHGMCKVKVNDSDYGRIKVNMVNNDKRGIQMQTHPNIDKKLFNSTSTVVLKNPDKPFPIGQDVGVLKWRFQSQDEANMPLSINCWPNETPEGCEVNIEYGLEQQSLELQDVLITIPLPSGVGGPVVGDCDGEYHYESRKNQLQWSLPVIDKSNKNGSLEFSIAGHPDDFFPVEVTFVSKLSYCDLQISEVLMLDGEQPIKYSSETLFYVDKYEFV
ncbi:coatomer subunit delta-like [Mizuhopecten yessoensis]|uniref:Coatomer subunit delta n=1 Tax=Mizuhopecten yessoensis TaxID=6573 RepID=A0A210PSZ3_MIZYE|nr:coatomer subunit delta-like [Mizuhopecten yessoensis]OWF39608.1 Coatomer subunit delta [Mizuhopecten yessoensis]